MGSHRVTPIPPFLAGRDVSPASGLLGSKSASNATTPGLQARLHSRFPGLSRRRSAGHPEGSQLHACRMTATRSAALGKTSCHHKLHRSVFPLSPAYPSGSQSFVNLNKRAFLVVLSLQPRVPLFPGEGGGPELVSEAGYHIPLPQQRWGSGHA